jgi:hypothetical protein
MAKTAGRAFWAKLISEFESNDERERRAAFGGRHGVRLTTLRTWLYRLRIQAVARAKRAVRLFR